MVVLSVVQYVVFRTGGFERNLELIPNKKREETEMSSKSRSIRPGSAGRTKTQCGCSKTSSLEVILTLPAKTTIALMRAGTKPPPNLYEPTPTVREPSVHLCSEVQLTRPPRVGSWLRPVSLPVGRGSHVFRLGGDPGKSMVSLK